MESQILENRIKKATAENDSFSLTGELLGRFRNFSRNGEEENPQQKAEREAKAKELARIWKEGDEKLDEHGKFLREAINELL